MEKTPVNLWRGELTVAPEQFQHYWQLLASTEKLYANTLHNETVHRRFVEVRARLRLALSQWLNSPPEKIRIEKTEHGKPYLLDYPELSFNLSHSTNQIVVAAAQNCFLGVDIEQCKPRSNLIGLVNKCFAEEEQEYWFRLPDFERLPVFYRFWTRKEAFVKATGLGIKLGLNHCAVNPKSMDDFIRLPEAYGDIGRWQIQAIDLGWSMTGAIVLADSNKLRQDIQVMTYTLPTI